MEFEPVRAKRPHYQNVSRNIKKHSFLVNTSPLLPAESSGLKKKYLPKSPLKAIWGDTRALRTFPVPDLHVAQ